MLQLKDTERLNNNESSGGGGTWIFLGRRNKMDYVGGLVGRNVGMRNKRNYVEERV